MSASPTLDALVVTHGEHMNIDFPIVFMKLLCSELTIMMNESKIVVSAKAGLFVVYTKRGVKGNTWLRETRHCA